MMDTPPGAPEEPPILTKEAQDRWASLPSNVPLQISLTRDDLDNLFLAIRESIICQSDLAATMVALSNGDLELAQKNFSLAKGRIGVSLTYIDHFILHAMKTAEPV